jgi:hypothetical protein
MTLYKDQGGKAYKAADAKELVSLMRRNDDYEQSPSDEAFMLKSAKRAQDEHGLTLSTESPETFVASLLATGLLEEDDEEEQGDLALG